MAAAQKRCSGLAMGWGMVNDTFGNGMFYVLRDDGG
jgi:hypothetical protein